MFQCRDLILQLCVLSTKGLILLFQTAGDGLQGDMALDFALLVATNSFLKFGKMFLLPFSKSTLSHSII
jgi:hypothetical protein